MSGARVIERGEATRTDIFSIVDKAVKSGTELLTDWNCDDEDVTVQEIFVLQFDFDEPYGVTFGGSGESEYYESLEDALAAIEEEGTDLYEVMLHVMRPHPDYNHESRHGLCDEAIIWWDKKKTK